MNGDELAPGSDSGHSDGPHDGPDPSTDGAEASAGSTVEADGADGADVGSDADLERGDEGFAAPFVARSFGGEFVWAEAESYTAKILRVKPGEKVVVSTRGRRDMVAMLTGGRAVLEVLQGDEVDRVEMMPAAPVAISPDAEYRLVALTEVELFTIYTVL